MIVRSRHPSAFPPTVPLREAPNGRPSPNSGVRHGVWRLEVPETGSGLRAMPEEWLRSLSGPVQFLLTSRNCRAQDVHPLGFDPEAPLHLPPDLTDLARTLAGGGLAERSLYLVTEKVVPGDMSTDLSLLGLEPTRLDPADEAALAARLLGGPHATLSATPSEVHLGRGVLPPLEPSSGAHAPRPIQNRTHVPLGRGIRTWNDLARPDSLMVDRGHLSVEGAVSILLTLDGLPRELGPDALMPLVSLAVPMDLSLRITPLDSDAVVRYLTRRLRDLRSGRILAAGTDRFAADDAIRDAQALREALYVGATRLWQVSVTLAAWGNDFQEARHHADACKSRLRQGGFLARTATFRQWDALVSLLPGQLDRLRTVHNVTSEAVLSLLPVAHVTPRRTGILLGRHAEDASPVHFARLSQPNPSALYLGTPGSGKSALGKAELRRVLLARPGDRALIVDPEGEYEGLVQAMDGIELRLDRNTTYHLSPFVQVERTPGLTADLLASCLEARDPIDLSAVRTALRHFLADMTALGEPLSGQGLLRFLPYLARSGAHLAGRLEDLMGGPLAPLGFADPKGPHRRVIAVGLSGVEPHLLPSLMTFYTHVLLDHLKPEPGGLRWLTVDEFHLFLRHEAGTRLLVQLTKRARKHGVVLTAITQHIMDLLGHPDGQAILGAAGSFALFEPGVDLRSFAEALRLRPSDLEWAARLRTGRALLFSGGRFVPVDIELSDLERRLAETRPLGVLAGNRSEGEMMR